MNQMTSDNVTVIAVIAAVVIFAIMVAVSRLFGKNHIELPERQAGRLGEKLVTTVISEILNEGDILLTNVDIIVDGMQAELDNVVINENGVFIIEAKNYAGEMFGSEDDTEWIMNSPDIAQIPIVNPILQVKRQMLLLSMLFEYNGIRTGVSGYVFFVNMNSPVKSDFILETRDDIDRNIHAGYEMRMDGETIERIIRLLNREGPA